MKKERRLLCRTVAKELKPEDLGLAQGADLGAALPGGGGVSTMMATLPDYREDA